MNNDIILLPACSLDFLCDGKQQISLLWPNLECGFHYSYASIEKKEFPSVHSLEPGNHNIVCTCTFYCITCMEEERKGLVCWLHCIPSSSNVLQNASSWRCTHHPCLTRSARLRSLGRTPRAASRWPPSAFIAGRIYRPTCWLQQIGMHVCKLL